MGAYRNVTDATFQTEVIDRSATQLVVVDLWAEWCGPCKTLGPILEKVVADTDGKAVLAKVDVDASPGVAQAFQVQSIPAVYLMSEGKVVDGFVGAQPEATVVEWLSRHLPSAQDDANAEAIAAGDVDALRAVLVEEPDNAAVITALAGILAAGDDPQGKVEALELLAKIPETNETRHIAAMARAVNPNLPADVEDQLDRLLTTVKTDDDDRQSFVDLLELMGPTDPRTADYRKKLAAALF